MQSCPLPFVLPICLSGQRLFWGKTELKQEFSILPFLCHLLSFSHPQELSHSHPQELSQDSYIFRISFLRGPHILYFSSYDRLLWDLTCHYSKFIKVDFPKMLCTWLLLPLKSRTPIEHGHFPPEFPLLPFLLSNHLY